MNRCLLPVGVIALAVTWLLPVAVGVASDEEEAPRQITYAPTPPAPKAQSPMQAAAKSDGCSSCHTKTDQATMHPNAAVVLGCTDCHGGDARVGAPATLAPNDPAYRKLERIARSSTDPGPRSAVEIALSPTGDERCR